MTPPAAQANAEAVIAGLNVLRNEQRSLASKLAELQMDLNEHKLVIDTIVGVDTERRCFRLVGGVLVERKVSEVSPALQNNKDKISKLIETLEKQLSEKGVEINAYIAKNNIQVRGVKKDNELESDKGQTSSPGGGQGVLVQSEQK